MRPVLVVVLLVLAVAPVAAAEGPRAPRGQTAHVHVATAAAKVPNRLRVSGLAKRYSGRPGNALTVRGKLRNRGRRGATPTVTVVASRAGAGRITLGRARVGRVPARRGTRFSLRVRVPAALGAGRYRLRACARVSFRQRNRCSPARPLDVRALATPTPTPTPTPAPSPIPTPAIPPAPAPPTFTDGARSIGDSLFPAIGNGGYDALHYGLDLAYDPPTKVLVGTSTLTARATQPLRSFSLDLQGLQVSAVTVDGAPAFFARDQTKLVVTPAAGIPEGASFDVAVTYGGAAQPVIDPDGALDGFIPTPTGAVVVSEPIGAQGWFPNNNTPRDKATFDVEMTVPRGKEVIGNGVLVSRLADATTETFHWREAQPMATYLATATIGDYRIVQATSPAGVPLYTAVDTAANGSSPKANAAKLAANQASLLAGGAVVDYFAGIYGPYPFETSGGIIANAPEIGYQLEVQGRPVYTSNDAAALEHELAHQWWGDQVTLTDWRDIWLAEGFAVWSEWRYTQDHGGITTAQAGADAYAEPDDPSDDTGTWRPLVVTDATALFGSAPYQRGGTLVEALRQRLGTPAFEALLREYQTAFAYGNATTEQFVALAQTHSATSLKPFFDDWLYRDGKPTTTPPQATYAG